MTDQRRAWIDEAAGPLVRPYVVTRGRTDGARYDLDVITMVVAVDRAPRAGRVEPEYGELLALCVLPMSVAELAAAMTLPLAVTKILVSDLIEDGRLVFRSPATIAPSDAVDVELLHTVLTHIRNL